MKTMAKCVIISMIICGVLSANLSTENPKQVGSDKPNMIPEKDGINYPYAKVPDNKPEQNQPPMWQNKPPMDQNKPPMDQIKPPMDQNKPPMWQNKPPVWQNKPPVWQNKPPMDQNKPPKDQNKPPMEQNKPPKDQNKPPMEQNKPPMEQNKPPMEQNKPSKEQNKPPMEQNKPPKDNNQDQNGKPNTPSSKSCCPKTPFCQFYQVTTELNDYGCTKCMAGTSLQVNQNGAGICLNKSVIKHCIWETVTSAGLAFCQLCEKNYAIDMSARSCSFNDSTRIPNCFSYRRVIIGSSLIPVCARCKDNFTLVFDAQGNTTCEENCDIPSCRACVRDGDTDFCQRCKDNTIGVVNSSNGYYEECLSCKEWIKELLTPTMKASDI